MQATRGTSSLPAPSPHSTVLYRRHEVCSPLVSTHRMVVGVGAVVEVVVSRADLGFKHIAPDTANSPHRKLPTPQTPDTARRWGGCRTACGQVRPL